MSIFVDTSVWYAAADSGDASNDHFAIFRFGPGRRHAFMILR